MPNNGSNSISVLRNADLPPTITSFSPTNAKLGLSITLTGTNFNATPANNVVFFGATKATVTAATATSVTVIVPSGATYAPITLLNTGTSLAAYSLSNFTPTYSPAKTAIRDSDFQSKQDFATSAAPYSVAMGDLDGDGKPELVVVSISSNSVSVYRNTSSVGSVGSGSFAAKVDFATGSSSKSIAIGDLDGDGKLDLAVTNSYSNSVSVIRNTSTVGSLSFATKVDFTTNYTPVSLALSDLDGDGKSDLAVASNISATVSVLRNTSIVGSISFATKVDFATGELPISVALSDLDRDGKTDLAVANNASASVSVFRNTSTSGSISFASKVDFATGVRPISLAIGNFDGDARPDFVIANQGSNSVSVIRNTSTSGSIGPGSFANKVDFATDSNPFSVAVGDMDGDGKLDLAVTNSYSNSVSVIRNTYTSGNINTGSFANKVDFVTDVNPLSVAVGDLDGDGKPDLAVANVGNSSVSVLRNTDLPPSITSFSPTNAKPGSSITLTGTNFNATPANNIVFFGATKATVTSATATSITVTVPASATYAPITLLNTGTKLAAYSLSNFTPTYSPAKTAIIRTDFQTKQDFATDTNPVSVAMGDLDGDGKPDLVVTNKLTFSVSVYRNTSTRGSLSSASFAAKKDFTAGDTPYSVAIGDMDGDGKLDLAISNFFSNSVSVLLNTSTIGNIGFANKVDFGTAEISSSVAIGDLDGDGKLDLAATNEYSNSVSIIRNTSSIGSIRFADKVDFVTGSTPYSVAIGDLDRDGKPDLAVANSNSGSVSVFRNTSTSGSIGFVAKVDFATGNSPWSVAIGDLDGDSSPDLAVANASSNTVSVIRNTSIVGSIRFANKVDFATGSTPKSVAIGELNGDGKPDLAVANNDPSSVSIIRNNSSVGSIGFTDKVDFVTEDLLSQSVAIGDLDGDDRPDLAVANERSSSVSVFRNANANADLSTLTLSAGTLNPTFTAVTTTYTVSVANAITGLTLTPTLADANASVKVNSTTVVSGTASANIALNVGTNTITVIVTAQNLTTKTYTITVLRSILPTFNAVAPICNGATLTVLPTTSNNNITGTWSPTLNNLNTTTYTFTPTTGQNASSTTLTVTVNPAVVIPTPQANTQITLGGLVPLTATGCSGVNKVLKWYQASNNTLVTMPITVTAPTNYYAKCETTLNGITCISGKSTDVTVSLYPPTITSFSPTNAKPGAAVTLTGTNFNATPANNIVFFGATRATVTAATATRVTVTIPTGATYAPVTLLNTGTKLAAYSLSNFTPTYSPVKTAITAADFQTKQDFTTSYDPYSVAISDLDGDSKPDLVLANRGSNTISVYRNTSTNANGSFSSGSFATKVDFTTGSNPISVAIGDLDGDGKPDLAVANSGSASVSIFRNKSTSGSIGIGSFSPKVDYATGNEPNSVAIGDLDRDGKLDLVVVNFNYNSNSVSVIRNTATSGIVDLNSFAPKVDFATGNNPISLAIGDLDGDGKPDLAVANQGSYSVSVIRNVSTNGIISFANKTDFAMGDDSRPRSVAIGDLDGDGKPDLAMADYALSKVLVMRNISTTGTISTGSFANKVDFETAFRPHSVAMGDLDGDGKPDLVLANYLGNSVSVIRNTSTSGSIGTGSFAAKVDFTTGSNPRLVAIGDLDGDGRPDLAVANIGSNSVSVLRNANSRIYVNIAKIASPTQDGKSWATAYGSLQVGLAAAIPGRDVWVAKGTYKPTTNTTRTIYFNIPNNIAVYGGFAGTEDNLSQRDLRTNPSILSGDIGIQNASIDNSYHVVVMNGSSRSTVLDGFTISGGNANFDPKKNSYPSFILK